jgi:HEPN domain-containing protein
MLAENINIPARPLVALSKLSSRYHMEIEMSGDLAARVNRWFDSLYGERLQIGFSLGVTGILVAGDFYKIRIPLMFGTTGFVFDMGPAERKTVLHGKEVVLSNITKYVQGLTPARVQSMTVSECNEVVTTFGNATVARSSICSVRYPEFVGEARADLDTSVEHLLSQPPQCGLSRWALLAVEKFLKALIQERGGQVRTIHKLSDLASDAESVGLKVVDRTALAAIQCAAGVRYGEEPSTMQEAVAAHRTATEVCGAIATEFKNRDHWRILLIDGQSKDLQRRMVLLMRGMPADFARAGIGPEHLKN